jgi:hypothetical protein
VADVNTQYALGFLLNHKRRLSRQQYKTLKGQILAGDPDGALRGLQRLLILAGSNAIKKP